MSEADIMERAWRSVRRVMPPSESEPGQPNPARDEKAQFAINIVCGILPGAMGKFTSDIKLRGRLYARKQVQTLLEQSAHELGNQFNSVVETLTDGLAVLALALYESQGLLGAERAAGALREALLRSGARGREEAEEAEFRGYLA